MKPPHNDSIWPDDTQRAAVTLALAAATNSGMQFHDVINSITDALNSGRPLQFVMELIRLLTAGLGGSSAIRRSPRLTGSWRHNAKRTRTTCVPVEIGGTIQQHLQQVGKSEPDCHRVSRAPHGEKLMNPAERAKRGPDHRPPQTARGPQTTLEEWSTLYLVSRWHQRQSAWCW